MLEIGYTPAFLSDYKKLKKKNYNMELLDTAIKVLAKQDKEMLSRKYKDHALKGNWKGYREIHVAKDWLVIYRVDKSAVILTLVRSGKHDEIL